MNYCIVDVDEYALKMLPYKAHLEPAKNTCCHENDENKTDRCV